MREYPEIDCGGMTVTVKDRSDVQTVFESDSEFVEGTQVDEVRVKSIDYEFDFDSVSSSTVLRAVVYFIPTSEKINMAQVKTESFSVPQWDQPHFSVGDRRLGITYERRVPK